MDLSHLEALRLAELADVHREVRAAAPPGARLLEIGAGTGWQARRLAALGYTVAAVDVRGSSYAADRVWPVIPYDGRRLPFADASFDAIFSSNVLEHVAGLPALQAEMRRVLRPRGVAIHLVPSASWRLWETVTHYPFVVRSLVALLSRRWLSTPGQPGHDEILERAGRLPGATLLRKALLPSRHGATGSAAGELLSFRGARWRRAFEAGGWLVERQRTGRLFYTGRMLLGPALSLSLRRPLSRVLGSACHVFVLRQP